MPLILPGNVASALGTGYDVANSCLFEADTYMTKSVSSGSQRTFTLSFWYKRTNLTTGEHHFPISFFNDANNRISVAFQTGHSFSIYAESSSSSQLYLNTNRLFRDIGAWYHVCIAVDTTQGTEANRAKIYINGTQETSFADDDYPDQNADLVVNTDLYVGVYNTTNNFLHGYLSEVVYIDGTALAPTSFGEFDEDSPTIWKPIDVSGLTFGTNGFYLDFEASGNLGNDANGGTDLSETNFAATDQKTDTPTNNFPTLNYLDKGLAATNPTMTGGNLILNNTTNFGDYGIRSTMAASAGKWYFEMKIGSSGGNSLNIIKMDERLVFSMTDNTPNSGVWGIQAYDASKTNLYNDSSYVSQNTAMWGGFTSSHVISIALDLDNGKIFFAKDNAYGDTSGNTGDPANGDNPTFTIGSYSSGADFYGFYTEARQNEDNGTQMNFGNPSFSISSGNADANGYGNFEFAPPSGFLALCSKNLGSDGG